MHKGYEFDATSQYPSAMIKEMPIGNPTLINKPSLKDVFNDDLLWFVNAEVYYHHTKMPPIPVRTDKGLTHPIGFFNCNVSGVELKHAVQECGAKFLDIH